MKKGLLFIAATTALLAACQKDDHLSMREMGIVKSSWKIKTRDTLSSVAPGNTQYDTLSLLQRSTRYRFLPGGDMARITAFALDTFRIEDSIISGKWTLHDADTRITITDPTLAGDHHFVQYNDSLMKLVLISPVGDADSAAVTTILRRQ